MFLITSCDIMVVFEIFFYLYLVSQFFGLCGKIISIIYSENMNKILMLNFDKKKQLCKYL